MMSDREQADLYELFHGIGARPEHYTTDEEVDAELQTQRAAYDALAESVKRRVIEAAERRKTAPVIRSAPRPPTKAEIIAQGSKDTADIW